MKKLFAVLLAATVFAAPLAQAQAQSHRNEPPRKEWRDDRRVQAPKKPVVKRWQRGEKIRQNVSQQRLGARDIRRHRLPEPRRGQHWVQVSNQFLLVNLNGLILSVAGR